MSNFNRVLLGKNIKFLAAKKGIKVGDLEKETGVSTGYFSRLSNEENKSGTTIVDTIIKVAEKLGSSINTLLSTDLTNLTPNEMMLSKFFDKLNSNTENNTIIWELETKNRLEDVNYQINHPLFKNIASYGDGYDMVYHSLFDPKTFITDDCYKVNLNDKILYLMKVNNSELFEYGFELYFFTDFQNGLVERICCAYKESSLFNQIENLYKIAAESSRHVKLSQSVMNTINDYLDPDFPSDIPF